MTVDGLITRFYRIEKERYELLKDALWLCGLTDYWGHNPNPLTLTEVEFLANSKKTYSSIFEYCLPAMRKKEADKQKNV